jgi:hypothetical protein
MEAEDRVHLVMRFSDGFLSAEDTVLRHMEVLNKHGLVWIGKVGKPLGEKWIAHVNLQVAESEPAFLFLVQKVGKTYEAHKAKILQVAKTLPESERKKVPKYYHESEIFGQVSLWVKLGSITKLSQGALLEYRIASSGRPLLSSLRNSMAALFVIKEGRGVDY